MATAARTASLSSALVMPIDEPRLAGLTKTGRPELVDDPREEGVVDVDCPALPGSGPEGCPAVARPRAWPSPCPCRGRSRARPLRRRARRPARAGPARCRPRRAGRGAAAGRRSARRRAGASVGSGSTPGPTGSSDSGSAREPPSVRTSIASSAADPLSLPRDPDRQHVVPAGIDGPEHVGGGDAGHVVFGRDAAEQDDQAGAIRRARLVR